MNFIEIFLELEKCEDAIQGIQDNNLETIGDNLFSFNGFCSGSNYFHRTFRRNKKKNKENIKMLSKINKLTSFKRGFYNSIYKYSIKKNKWYFMGDLPIKPRQCASSININNKIYIWGGYSYTPLTEKELNELKILPQKKEIKTFNDGICFEYINNKVCFKNIPKLPYPLANFNMIYLEKKIFFFGGSIYSKYGYDTNLLINNEKIGKGFFKINLDENDNIIGDFEFINNFPGTDRMSSIFFEHNNDLYIIGGSSIYSKKTNEKGYSELTPTNVLDNWNYNICDNKWKRLKDLPFFLVQQGFVKYKNKYVIMIGGVKFNYSKYLEEIFESDNNKFKKFDFKLKYNGISDIKDIRHFPKKYTNSYNKYFSNLIIIYDIKNDTYLLPNKRLNININQPSISLHNDDIYIYGGEANATYINDLFYGIHLSLIYKLNINIPNEL